MQTADVVRAASFLAAHASEPLRLGDVADHVGYSPFHLARSFERELGTPPGRFLAAHRFAAAKRLLLSGNDRVVDVCHAAGFSAPGTFATRFTGLVGTTPTDFRRLPALLAASPPRPVSVPGTAERGATVVGRVLCTAAAAKELGAAPAVYVGLFPRRAARGAPVAGALVEGFGPFVLSNVPAGSFFVLAAALAADTPYDEQLVPRTTVAGAAPRPLHSAGTSLHRRDVVVDVQPGWSAPVLVALPRLASPAGHDWKRKIGDDGPPLGTYALPCDGTARDAGPARAAAG